MLKLIMFAAAAVFVNGQGVAAKAEPPKQQTAPMERKFSEDEITKLSLISSQIEVVRNKNKVEELEKSVKAFQEELAPITARQEALIKAACLSVGVAEDKIKAGECGISLGYDPTGKPIMGADGKPVESKVWHIVQKVPPTFPAATATSK